MNIRWAYLLSVIAALWLAFVPGLSAAHALSHLDDHHADEAECEICLVADRADGAPAPFVERLADSPACVVVSFVPGQACEQREPLRFLGRGPPAGA